MSKRKPSVGPQRNSPVKSSLRRAETIFQLSVNAAALRATARDGRPLRIFNTQYARGLYLDGAKGAVVHLTSPAKTFEALAGLDGSYTGCGYTNANQEFSVATEGKTIFQPAVVKVATAPVEIKVPLNGATEFSLLNGQDAEKDWCGDAVWANARVTLENGEHHMAWRSSSWCAGRALHHRGAIFIYLWWKAFRRVAEEMGPKPYCETA